jgi:hypothetical protein
MKIIRASDLGSYCYCRRAWWYQLLGYESKNQAELSGGSEYHAQHGRSVTIAGCLNTLAVGLLVVALAALSFWLIGILF